MTGLSRHFVSVFWLCSTTAISFGQVRNAAPDSLFVSGLVAVTPDSLFPDNKIQVDLGGLKLSAGDSTAALVERGAMMTGWARGPLGRLQFDAPLPKYADSCQFWMGCDTLGLTLVLGMDTLRWNWNPEDEGCFPVATVRELDEILSAAHRLPFESSRLNLIVNWLAGKCAATDQIGRLAAAFDDEARRLEVIQSATCGSPSDIHRLNALFASQHYRSVFLEWAPPPH